MPGRSKYRTPHLGNLLGAIIPAIQLSNKPEMNRFFSLLICSYNANYFERIPTTQPQQLACGLDVNKVVFIDSQMYANSRIVLVFELFFPFQRLTLAFV
jgi:tryptophanyl-tRNA synthetase